MMFPFQGRLTWFSVLCGLDLRRGELEDRFTGWVDVPLTDKGREEARRAGEKLRDIRFDIAYTSVLSRAQETLDVIQRVRAALPKFVMRGVSGPTFGKTFGVVGTLTLGRSTECDVSIPTDPRSRVVLAFCSFTDFQSSRIAGER